MLNDVETYLMIATKQGWNPSSESNEDDNHDTFTEAMEHSIANRKYEFYLELKRARKTLDAELASANDNYEKVREDVDEK